MKTAGPITRGVRYDDNVSEALPTRGRVALEGVDVRDDAGVRGYVDWVGVSQAT